jgi:hypothetical protein
MMARSKTANAYSYEALKVLQVYGKEEWDTLKWIGELASTYCAQGNFAAPADMEEVVLMGRKKTLGEEHPATLTSMNNLAAIFYHQRNLQGAATLLERVIEVRKWTFR